MILVAKVIWIKEEFGGRSAPPQKGLRPIIRFQRYILDWIEVSWDVEIIEIFLNTNTWDSTVNLKFTKNCNPKKEWLKKDELIELLDAYRVIAVGKIIDVLD